MLKVSFEKNLGYTLTVVVEEATTGWSLDLILMRTDENGVPVYSAVCTIGDLEKWTTTSCPFHRVDTVTRTFATIQEMDAAIDDMKERFERFEEEYSLYLIEHEFGEKKYYTWNSGD